MSENYGPQNPYGQTPGEQNPYGQTPGGQPGWQPGGPQPQPGQAQPPSYGQPAPYGQPAYGQQPPTYAQPNYGQQPPTYGQPVYGQPAYSPQGAVDPQHAYAPPDPATPPAGSGSGRKSRTAMIITVAAVVLALVAGGGFYYFAHKDTQSAGGQASPQEAANAMLLSLSQKDPIGVADQLDPAEASLFADLNGEFLTQLKRLDILQPSATATSITGSTITVTGLTYGSAPDQINDHITVVKLTGGTVTVTTDPAKLPVTDKIKAVAGTALARPAKTQTYQIADEVKKLGHPIRIATVDRNGKWYPSLFYTAADYWAQQSKVGNPTAADFIAPAGGTSPEDAMNQLLAAATGGDYDKLIALLPPQEMGVMHDYGKLITSRIPKSGTAALGSVKFSGATWNVSDVAGGKLVSLKTLTITTGSQSIAVTRDVAAGSLSVAVSGQPPIVLSKDTIGKFIATAMGGSSSAVLTPQVITIIGNEFQQLMGVGVVMTQDGSQWYASPVRSYAELFVTLMKGLQPSDIDYFLSLAKK